MIDEELLKALVQRGVDGRELADWQNLDASFLAQLLDTAGTPMSARVAFLPGTGSAAAEEFRREAKVPLPIDSALHKRRSASSRGSISAGSTLARSTESDSHKPRRSPSSLRTLTIAAPTAPTTTVTGVMETLPEWHECDDSENCPTWQWRHQIVVALETRHGVKIADGLEGDIYIVEKSDGTRSVAKALNHDGTPTVNQKMFPYSPSCSSQHRMSLQSPPLSALPSPNAISAPVSPGRSVQSPTSISTSVQPAWPRRIPFTSLRRVSRPRLDTSGASSSDPALRHFPSVPLLRSTSSTQQLRPSMPPSAKSAPSVPRTSAESIRSMFSSPSTWSPSSKPQRSRSIDLRRALSTVAEDVVVDHVNVSLEGLETPITGPGVPTFAGWMKRRKDKLLHQEWQLRYCRLYGSKLTLHRTDSPQDTRVLKTFDLADYHASKDGAASKIGHTKMTSILKAIKLSSSKSTSPAPADSPSVFELVPLPVDDAKLQSKAGKVYHFAVANDTQREQWMRQSWRASAWGRKEHGSPPLIDEYPLGSFI